MKFLPTLLPIVLFAIVASSCTKQDYTADLRTFIEQHQAVVEPLFTAYANAYWNATATGEKNYYDEMQDLEMKIRTIYSNKKEFEHLKTIKDAGTVTDPLLSRQLTILYNAYLPNQIDSALMKQMVELSTKIQARFNTFRPKLDGKEVSDNDILNILKTELKSEKRQKAWEASKQVGVEIAEDLKQLIKLRNEAARKLGFKNYYEMAMTAGEQKVEDVVAIFTKLKEKTDAPFKELKAKIDSNLAVRFGVAAGELMPWHYEDPFFQRVPQVSKVDFDKFYKGRNIEQLGADFYSGIGLDVSDILKKSDLYERKGKYPHAYCMDVDKKGDVRVMLNIKDDANWMETMLHELGHAVYSKNCDRALPYFLRQEAHTFTTEAIAQMMERQAKNPDWMQQMLGISDADKAAVAAVVKEDARLKALIFCRWSMVMMFFEKAMYENPDQDLNKLWWDMVEQYQFLKRPEGRNLPDYAAKIHLSQSPVYYHNYLLGELFSSQLMHSIVKKVFKLDKSATVSFYKNPEVGKFLVTNVFAPGASKSWNDMIKAATGEFLNPDYYINEFVVQ
jgi:peptidyl-dipeptidase A